MNESFSASQIAALKAEYSKINGIDPDSDIYKKLIAMLDRLDLKSLQSLAGAEVKFVSKLAQNRVARKSMKKEEVEIDEGSGPKEKQTSKYVDRTSAESKAKVQAAKDRMVSDKKAEAGKALLSKLKKEEVESIDELSTNKLADYKKKAGADASAADKAGDMKRGNKRFSGIMKATRKQFGNDAKQKTEELSPKQKAMDKNKNGKIDGFDLAKLRGEELSAKQKVLDKNKNGKIDGSDLAKLRKEETDLQEKSDYEVYHKDYSGAVQAAIKQAEKRGYEVDMDDWHDKVATGPKKPSSGKTNSFSVNLMKDGKPSKKKLQMQVYNMDDHKYELNMYIEEVQQGVVEAAGATKHRIGLTVTDPNHPMVSKRGETYQKSVRVTGDDREKAINSAIAHYRRKGYKVHDHNYMGTVDQGVAEETLSELNKDTLHSYAKKSEKDQDDQFNKIGKGIRDNDPKSANKAGHKFSMRSIGQNRAEKQLAKEAASPAQQAAIAIAMKKAGKKPKDMKEGIVDKIKAIKRGMQAKAKADDHFDKAGDPKNANASKDLKKAVRYHNLLNKEEVVLEAKKPKSFKDVRKKMKKEETPDNNDMKVGDSLSGKKEPIQLNPELNNK